MNNIIFTFDIYSLIIVGFLSVIYLFQTKLKNRYFLWFGIMLLSIITSVFFELIAIYTLNHSNTYGLVFRITIFVSLFFSHSFPITLYAFTVKLFDSKIGDKHLKRTCNTGYFIVLLISSLSLIPGVLFKQYTGNIETTNFYYLFHIVASVYTYFIFRHSYKNRQLLTRLRRFVLATFVVIFLAIIVLSFIFSYVPFFNFLISMFLITVYISIFTGEKYTVKNMTVKNYVAFKKILSLKLISEDYKRFYYIFVSENVSSLKRQVGSDDYHTADKEFSEYLGNSFGPVIYKIDNERYVVVSKTDLSKKIEEKFFKNTYNIRIGDTLRELSPLVATFSVPSDFNTSNDIITACKDRSFLNKKNNKKIFKLNSSILNNSIRDSLIEEEIRLKTSNDSFDLQFRPIFEKKTSSYSAVALYLLFGEEKDYISLPEVTRIAANSGLLSELETSLFASAGRFIQEVNLDSLHINRVFIYLSTLQISKKDHYKTLIKAYYKYNKKSFSYVTILLTEVPGFIDFNETNFNIMKLRQAGAKVYISEFGSGYSTLDFIFKCSFDGIKTAYNIAAEALSSKNSQAMLRYILNIAKDAKKEVYLSGYNNKELDKIIVDYNVKYLSGLVYGSYKSRKDIVPFLEYKLNENR